MLEEVADFVRFGDADVKTLVALGPLLEPDLPGIVDAFYDAIERSPRARAVFQNEAQTARQTISLRRWLDGIFSGTYDAAYFERRARIGRAHVRIGLDQRYMFAAMNVVRMNLHEAIELRLPPRATAPELREAALGAVDRILDIELAIMLETYAEAYLQRTRAVERLATLGQLAASIGHELRNPLAVMETSLHLLRRAAGDDPKLQRHTERIGSQVDVCSEIITDLLDLARDRPLERRRVAPGQVLADALALVPASDVRVEVALEEPLPDVAVDPGQLRQVLSNLISNAVAATQGHGEKVTVRVRVARGELRIEVDDEGMGIPDAVRERLFEPLFTTRAKGIGLGLSLCQRIVDKHQGSIVASNRPEGGARFEVRLPAVLPEAT